MGGGATPRGAPLFEESADSLHCILENDDDDEGDAPPSQGGLQQTQTPQFQLPSPGGAKLRRMCSGEAQRAEKSSAQDAQAAELQALFKRRESGMGLRGGGGGGGGSGAGSKRTMGA